MSQRRGVAGNALSTPAARAAAAAPAGAIAAGAGSHRTPGGPRRAAQPAVRRPVAHRGSCHVARRADLPLLPAHDVSRARRGPRSARAARTGPASGLCRPRAGRDGPEAGLVLGYHQAQGPGSVSLLLALCDPRPLQPLRRGLDGRAARECAPGRAPAGGDLREAGHHAAPTHHSRGPRCAHAQHTRRAALLGPGYHPPVIRGPA